MPSGFVVDEFRLCLMCPVVCGRRSGALLWSGVVVSVKLEFARRLGGDWTDLAAVLNIPTHRLRTFRSGREAYEIWEYLTDRDLLGALTAALVIIGRQDLAHVVSADVSPHEAVPGSETA